MRFLFQTTIVALLVSSLGLADELEELRNKQFDARDTLAEIDEPSDDARNCLEGLVWKPAEFKVRCESSKKHPGDLLVRFPTPFASGDAVNDMVAMEWYVARDSSLRPIKARAIVVVHESNSKMVVGRLFARGMRNLGVHAFLIHLPYYGERRGEEKPSAARLIQRAVQAIADVRRARDAVAALPLVDTEQIALQGTSLGGFISATSASLDQGYDSVFLLLAGGDLYDIVQNGKRDAANARKSLEASGLAGEKLKELLHTIEPTRVAHRLSPTRTWLFSGERDTVVPIKNALALATAAKLKGPHHVRLNSTHYSGIIYLPYILDHIAKRVRASQSAADEK
jgi:dienelactone hydrolase